jgi:hypothetical protein
MDERNDTGQKPSGPSKQNQGNQNKNKVANNLAGKRSTQTTPQAVQTNTKQQVQQPQQSPKGQQTTAQPVQTVNSEPLTPYVPPPASPDPSAGMLKKHLLKILIAVFGVILVFALLIGSGISLAYNDYKVLGLPKFAQNFFDFLILKGPLPKNERLVLGQIPIKMAEVKSAIVENALEVRIDSNDFPLKNAKIKFVGPIDFRESDLIRSKAEISGSIALEGIEFSASASVVQVGDYFYFKLNEVPGGSLIRFDDYRNQWFFVRTEDSSFQTSNLNDSADLLKKMIPFVEKTREWTTLVSTKDEHILTIKPPREEVSSFIYSLIKEIDSESEGDVGADDVSLKKFTDGLQKVEINLNVRKKSYLINGITFSAKIEVPDIPLGRSLGEVNLLPTTSLPVNINVSTKLREYDKQTIIDPPRDAKDFKQIIEDLTGDYLKEFQQRNENVVPIESKFLDPSSSVIGEKTSPWDVQIIDVFLRIS